jgi:hypothetical protein
VDEEKKCDTEARKHEDFHCKLTDTRSTTAAPRAIYVLAPGEGVLTS